MKFLVEYSLLRKFHIRNWIILRGSHNHINIHKFPFQAANNCAVVVKLLCNALFFCGCRESEATIEKDKNDKQRFRMTDWHLLWCGLNVFCVVFNILSNVRYIKRVKLVHFLTVDFLSSEVEHIQHLYEVNLRHNKIDSLSRPKS